MEYFHLYVNTFTLKYLTTLDILKEFYFDSGDDQTTSCAVIQ